MATTDPPGPRRARRRPAIRRIDALWTVAAVALLAVPLVTAAPTEEGDGQVLWRSEPGHWSTVYQVAAAAGLWFIAGEDTTGHGLEVRSMPDGALLGRLDLPGRSSALATDGEWVVVTVRIDGRQVLHHTRWEVGAWNVTAPASASQLEPDVTAGWVAWREADKQGDHLLLVDLRDDQREGVPSPATDGTSGKTQLNLGDRFLAWQDDRNAIPITGLLTGLTAAGDRAGPSDASDLHPANTDIYVLDRETGRTFPVSTASSTEIEPAVDGQRIAFVSTSTSGTRLQWTQFSGTDRLFIRAGPTASNPSHLQLEGDVVTFLDGRTLRTWDLVADIPIGTSPVPLGVLHVAWDRGLALLMSLGADGHYAVEARQVPSRVTLVAEEVRAATGDDDLISGSHPTAVCVTGKATGATQVRAGPWPYKQVPLRGETFQVCGDPDTLLVATAPGEMGAPQRLGGLEVQKTPMPGVAIVAGVLATLALAAARRGPQQAL